MFNSITTKHFYNYYIESYCLTREAKIADYKLNENHMNKVPDSVANKKSDYFLERAAFTKVLKSINSKIRDHIIFNNFSFNMPHRLGVIEIKKVKRKPYIDADGKVVLNVLPVNWKATKELWASDEKAKENKTLVRHTNEHTNGFIARWHYAKRTANYKNKTVYKFKPCRTAQRTLAKAVKENTNLDYYLK